MHELSCSVDIAAPIQRVWLVVTNFAAYPLWNPFGLAIQGDLLPGAPIKICLRRRGGRGCTLRGRVTIVEPEARLRWAGYLLVAGLIDVQQTVSLVRLDEDHTRLLESTRLSGVLITLIPGACNSLRLICDDRRGALKVRAEAAGRMRSRS